MECFTLEFPPGNPRAVLRIPCSSCVDRASEQPDTGTRNGAHLELCQSCFELLHRPRRSQKREINVRTARCPKNAVFRRNHLPTAPSPWIWSKDRREEHAVQFFIQQSAPQLAGHFDAPFWQRMVLQAGRQASPIKHALAAIGTLHEKLLASAADASDAEQLERTRFALEQYNLSIRCLLQSQRYSDPPDLKLILTTCILFTCFESMQGNCEQATRHAIQGYHLLQQNGVSPGQTNLDQKAFAVEANHLRNMLQRLCRQCRHFKRKYSNPMVVSEPLFLQGPMRFSNLSEARTTLEMLLHQLEAFLDSVRDEGNYYDLTISSAEKHLLSKQSLDAWKVAFTKLLDVHGDGMSAHQRKAARILEAHHIAAEILGEVDISLGELGWDAYREKFAAIIDLAGTILNDEQPSDASSIAMGWKVNGVFISSPAVSLSFSLGMVDLLYCICVHCRDPVLRRKALDLLAKYPRQECMWSSWSAWNTGRLLMRLEESAANIAPTKASEIPLQERISDSWFDFSIKSDIRPYRGRVAYKRATPDIRYAYDPKLFQGTVNKTAQPS